MCSQEKRTESKNKFVNWYINGPAGPGMIPNTGILVTNILLLDILRRIILLLQGNTES